MTTESNTTLEREYRERGWEGYGFTFEAFQRWRVISDGDLNALVKNTISLSPTVSPDKVWDQAKKATTTSRLSLESCESTDVMVRPEWADTWADVCKSLDEALGWHLAGIDPINRDYLLSMRFRNIRTAYRFWESLDMNQGKLGSILDRGISLARFPKSLLSGKRSGYVTDSVRLLIQLIDRHRLNQQQVDIMLSLLTAKPLHRFLTLISVTHLLEIGGIPLPDDDDQRLDDLMAITYPLPTPEDWSMIIHASLTEKDLSTIISVILPILEDGKMGQIDYVRDNLPAIIYGALNDVPIEWVDNEFARDWICEIHVKGEG